MTLPDRTTVGQQAQNLVYGERADTYGSVLEDHGRIAELWNVLFQHKLAEGEKFQAEDVSTAMRMVKESRLVSAPWHRDSLVDIVGYALTQEKCWNERHTAGNKLPPELNNWQK